MEDVRKLSGVKEVSNASKYISNPALFSNVFSFRVRASLKQNMPVLSLAMNIL